MIVDAVFTGFCCVCTVRAEKRNDSGAWSACGPSHAAGCGLRFCSSSCRRIFLGQLAEHKPVCDVARRLRTALRAAIDSNQTWKLPPELAPAVHAVINSQPTTRTPDLSPTGLMHHWCRALAIGAHNGFALGDIAIVLSMAGVEIESIGLASRILEATAHIPEQREYLVLRAKMAFVVPDNDVGLGGASRIAIMTRALDVLRRTPVDSYASTEYAGMLLQRAQLHANDGDIEQAHNDVVESLRRADEASTTHANALALFVAFCRPGDLRDVTNRAAALACARLGADTLQCALLHTTIVTSLRTREPSYENCEIREQLLRNIIHICNRVAPANTLLVESTMMLTEVCLEMKKYKEAALAGRALDLITTYRYGTDATNTVRTAVDTLVHAAEALAAREK